MRYFSFRENCTVDACSKDRSFDELKWHTAWECKVLSSIAKAVQPRTSNEEIGDDIAEFNSPNSETEASSQLPNIDSKDNRGLYNLIFPLRFVALKRTNPDDYKTLLSLESHLEKRRLQVYLQHLIKPEFYTTRFNHPNIYFEFVIIGRTNIPIYRGYGGSPVTICFPKDGSIFRYAIPFRGYRQKAILPF